MVEDPPVMMTYSPGAPPLQVMVVSCVRSIAATVPGLVHAKSAGKLRLELKCPTSLPPGPLSSVYVPPEGERKLFDTFDTVYDVLGWPGVFSIRVMAPWGP